MAKPSSITIIDDNDLRGVIAPSSLLSKEMLEDVIDLIELSSPESVAETERRIAEADRDNSWVPLDKVIKKAKSAK